MNTFTSDSTNFPHLYLLQLARAHRAFERYLVVTRAADKPTRDSYHEASDQFCAFFQSCWHVKDWLLNDETVEEDLRARCVKEAEKTRDLKIACDLANFSKHLVLTSDRTGAQHNGLVISHVGNDVIFAHRIEFRDGTEIDGRAQCHRCLMVWTSILNANGLPTIGASAT